MTTGAQETGMAISGQGAGPQHPTVEMATTRQAQEVQAAMVVAKKFPRDQLASHTRIMEACKRPNLAQAACYEYPRGGTKVVGPSIRLAEAMAQAWGNLDFGIIELEQKNGESMVMAYCWDLETNPRQTKIFNVPHIRYSKQKGNTRLTDPRDIYEMVANSGARRLRACILGIIPGDVQDDAIAQCNKTLAGQNKEPLIDRIKKMVEAFKEIGVTQDMLKSRLQHPVDQCTERELIQLAHVFNSINDSISTIGQHFDVKEEPKGDGTRVGKPSRKKQPEAKGASAGRKGSRKKEEPEGEPSAAETQQGDNENPPPGTDDDEALLAELDELQKQCPNKQWLAALEAAGIDEAAILAMEPIEKLEELKTLVKAAL